MLILAVSLQIAGNVSVGNQFCPGSTASFECQTTEGGLLWETSSSTGANHVFDDPTQPSTRMLGIFLLRLDGISTDGGSVNSTAVVSNVTLPDNGTTLKCFENVDLSMFSETVLRVAGECISHKHDTIVAENRVVLLCYYMVLLLCRKSPAKCNLLLALFATSSELYRQSQFMPF